MDTYFQEVIVIRKCLIALFLVWAGASHAMLIQVKRPYAIAKEPSLEECASADELLGVHFSSLHVSRTSTQVINKKAEQALDRYSLIIALLEKNDFPLDIQREITSKLYLLDRDMIRIAPHIANRRDYRIVTSTAIKEINERIAMIRSTGEQQQEDAYNAVLKKLCYDKVQLSKKGPITGRNLVRAFQYVDTTRIPGSQVGSLTPLWSPISLYYEHVLLKQYADAPYTQDLPVFNTKSVSPDIFNNLNQLYGANIKYKSSVYYQPKPNQVEHLQSLTDTAKFKWHKDPRHNTAVHGSVGVVWFTYPEQTDSQLTSQQSPWMHINAATEHLDRYELLQSKGRCILQ